MPWKVVTYRGYNTDGQIVTVDEVEAFADVPQPTDDTDHIVLTRFEREQPKEPA